MTGPAVDGRVAEVVGSPEPFCPGGLPDLLGPFLDGEPLDEPFERWP